MPSEHTYTYSQKTQDATRSLETLLTCKIEEKGALSFSEFMADALYHPELGYYTRGAANVGREGDFYTSVSVGACFGTILAHRLHDFWMELGEPEEFTVIEAGANTGQLAKDILDAIQVEFPQFYQTISYKISEHLEVVRSNQLATLAQHAEKISHVDGLDSIPAKLPHGVYLSNELVDALPFQILQKQDGEWFEKRVTVEEGKLAWSLSSELGEEARNLVSELEVEDGYQTEFRENITEYAVAAAGLFEKGLIITIDYGHTHSDYYAASRKTGTLRCYHNHQADEDPLALVGEKDITAHVEFTQLAKEFQRNGLVVTDFSSQAYYLVTHGKSWLIGLETNPTPNMPQLIRQFQALTHPANMGHKFHVLEVQTHGEACAVSLDKLELK